MILALATMLYISALGNVIPALGTVIPALGTVSPTTLDNVIAMLDLNRTWPLDCSLLCLVCMLTKD